MSGGGPPPGYPSQAPSYANSPAPVPTYPNPSQPAPNQPYGPPPPGYPGHPPQPGYPVSVNQAGSTQPGYPYPGPGYGGPPVPGYPGYQGPAGYGPPPMQAPPPMRPPAHQAGMRPQNAIYGHPGARPIRSTFFGDTPAPYQCHHCGKPGLSVVKHRISLAACVASGATMCFAFCFLLPCYDCLWHKTHKCEYCNQKVGELIKDDPCLIADPTEWTQVSYAIPA